MTEPLTEDERMELERLAERPNTVRYLALLIRLVLDLERRIKKLEKKNG